MRCDQRSVYINLNLKEIECIRTFERRRSTNKGVLRICVLQSVFFDFLLNIKKLNLDFCSSLGQMI